MSNAGKENRAYRKAQERIAERHPDANVRKVAKLTARTLRYTETHPPKENNSSSHS